MSTFKVAVMSRPQVIVVSSLVASWTHTHADYGWIRNRNDTAFGESPGNPPPPFLPQVVCGQLQEAAIHFHHSHLFDVFQPTSCLLITCTVLLCVHMYMCVCYIAVKRPAGSTTQST